MKDLAPLILRQRLVIEGLMTKPITDRDIANYLQSLAPILGMVRLTDAVTHRSPKFGWSGWVHWETSGAHFYAWEQPLLFFSIDIYTCKAFAVPVALNFTQQFFQPTELAYRAF